MICGPFIHGHMDFVQGSFVFHSLNLSCDNFIIILIIISEILCDSEKNHLSKGYQLAQDEPVVNQK